MKHASTGMNSICCSWVVHGMSQCDHSHRNGHITCISPGGRHTGFGFCRSVLSTHFGRYASMYGLMQDEEFNLHWLAAHSLGGEAFLIYDEESRWQLGRRPLCKWLRNDSALKEAIGIITNGFTESCFGFRFESSCLRLKYTCWKGPYMSLSCSQQMRTDSPIR